MNLPSIVHMHKNSCIHVEIYMNRAKTDSFGLFYFISILESL